MKKIKPILPSLREKKRYLAFEVISERKIQDFPQISKAIHNSSLRLLGDLEGAKAGIMILGEKYKDQKGIIRVNNKYLDKLKASFLFVEEIDGVPCILRSLGVSGMLTTATKTYIGG